MYPSIAIAKVFLESPALQLIDQLVQDVAISSMASERKESLSLWHDCDSPGSYLAIALSLEDDLVAHAWSRIQMIAGTEERVELAFGAADLHPMLPHRIHGQLSNRSEIGHLVSLSTRRADPGKQDELLDEVEGIFESLRYIPGYLGSAVGPNSAFPEEVIGLVFWSSTGAYEESGPRKGLYEIRLFERVL